MKRFITVVMLVLLFAACGAESAVEDTVASLSARKGDRVTVEIDRVWTDMRPLANTDRANAIFRLEIVEDAAKLGSDDPIVIHGGGTVVINHEEQYLTEEPIVATGRGQMELCMDDAPVGDGLFYPCGLPALELTAQIDGVFAEPVEAKIYGTAVVGNAKEETLEFPGLSVADMSGLSKVECRGQVIPGSNIAQIIMIGELRSGETVRGGGLLHLGDNIIVSSQEMLRSFQCSFDGMGNYAAVDGDLPADDLTMEYVEFENLTLTFENGESILLPTSYGFLMC